MFLIYYYYYYYYYFYYFYYYYVVFFLFFFLACFVVRYMICVEVGVDRIIILPPFPFVLFFSPTHNSFFNTSDRLSV